MTVARCIVVDWGTSSLRAMLLGDGGEVLERIARPKGILAVPSGGFAAEFDAVCGAWLAAHPDLPVLMSGMIGSRQGWVEAPYVAAPCGFEELTAGMITVPWSGGAIRIMPGVEFFGADGTPEVMRGEETQIAGVVDRHGVGDGLFCVPGTHSKWVHVVSGRIQSIATFMTGECFAVLKTHSILGRLMADEAGDDGAFRKGLERAATPGGLLHHLFAVRTLGLVGELPASGLAAYLSGQLIGAEIEGARGLFGPVAEVHLIGGGEVGTRYIEAFEAYDMSVARWDAEEAAIAALWAAAQATKSTGDGS
jgi:2-dehydro-3-deoxygalactonokinase